ncbi:MAG: GldG family protein [Gammaproteobacteria bacterium]|jgi:ABC-type uncharacterized transport system involved in gliding motility auxiliary subunit
MEITSRSRLLLRLQTWVFVVLFVGIIGLLGWLSTRYVYQSDWSAGSRNTISEDSRRLLDSMPDSITVTAYARENELLRKQIRNLIGSYQRFKPDITLDFVNPDTAPERVRSEGITAPGEVVVSYQGRSEHVKRLNEQQLSNALLRISRQSDRWIVFLSGHGERDPHGEANFDLGLFGKALERNGLNVEQVNLAETAIPANTSLLVIANPRVNLLPGEVGLLGDYIEQGGNLLWLAEPGRSRGLEPLAEKLGIGFLPGVVVDVTSQLFGVQSPSSVVVTSYPNHEVTREMDAVTVFPETAALEILENDTWQTTPLLSTPARSWTEIGALEGEVRFDENSDERAGPLDIAVAITRTPATENAADDAAPPREQRIAVLGDGDFLSNTYLGNVGNLDFGMKLVHWLSHDDAFIDILVRTAPDINLELDYTAQAVIGLGSLIGLPAILLALGIFIWFRRRGR